MTSVRVDTTPWLANSVVMGSPGFGVLAENIPATGDSGPGYAYTSLSLPADNGKEICGRITSWPSAGHLYAYEDTSFTFTGAPDGTYTFNWQLYVDGIAVGTPVAATLIVGGVTTHLTSGSLLSQNSTVVGSATKSSAGVKASSGALLGQVSALSGSSIKFGIHVTNGSLSNSVSSVVGSAAKTTLHATDGFLSNSVSSIVVGSATKNSLHSTNGSLSNSISSLVGSFSNSGISHSTSGIVSGAGSSITGSYANAGILHGTNGILNTSGSTINGSFVNFGITRLAVGSLTSSGSSLSGSATRVPNHSTNGLLVGQNSTITGGTSVSHLHLSNGALLNQSSTLSGQSNLLILHNSNGVLVGQSSILQGSNRTNTIHDCIGELISAKPARLFGWFQQLNVIPINNITYNTNSNVSVSNIELEGGVEYTFQVMYVNPVTGLPFDLTGYSAELIVHGEFESGSLFISSDAGEIVIDGINGVLTVTIPASKTLALGQFLGFYSLYAIAGGGIGNRIKITKGFLTSTFNYYG